MKINEREGIAGSWVEIDWGEKGTVNQIQLKNLFVLAIEHTPKGMPRTEIKGAFEKAMKEQGL